MRMRWWMVPVVCAVALAGCKPASKRVDEALKRGASWGATVKVVAEQWAQSNVSTRFARTTINTATTALFIDAESIRSLDPAAAARLDRLKNAMQPVMDAVALNEPDTARDAAKPLTSIVEPEPVAPTARPAAARGSGEAGP